ncbi:unnamed protein product, partial [Musa textilis]
TCTYFSACKCVFWRDVGSSVNTREGECKCHVLINNAVSFCLVLQIWFCYPLWGVCLVSPLRTFLHFVPWDESLASESAAVARDTGFTYEVLRCVGPDWEYLFRVFVWRHL